MKLIFERGVWRQLNQEFVYKINDRLIAAFLSANEVSFNSLITGNSHIVGHGQSLEHKEANDKKRIWTCSSWRELKVV